MTIRWCSGCSSQQVKSLSKVKENRMQLALLSIVG
jgi:hypothetical protein